ncbi:MAG: hypothetical protein OXI25_02750 [Chloroflexota bacterium]|nr:hypothetical protein [Chloroflexota bacterium]
MTSELQPLHAEGTTDAGAAPDALERERDDYKDKGLWAQTDLANLRRHFDEERLIADVVTGKVDVRQTDADLPEADEAPASIEGDGPVAYNGEGIGKRTERPEAEGEVTA